MVVHPLTDDTRKALSEEYVTTIIGTPVKNLARLLITEMAAAHIGSPTRSRSQISLKPEILVPEYM